MYAIAIIGDIFSLIPYVNIITDFAVALLLGMVASPEENIYSDGNITGTIVAIIVEAIPFASIIPTWTIRVYLVKQKAKLIQQSN